MDASGSAVSIRVENQPGVRASQYGDITPSLLLSEHAKPFRLLFIKPFNDVSNQLSYGPPLGILTLISGLRSFFREKIQIDFWDMKLYNDSPSKLASRLDDYNPDVIGVSALNCEAAASYEIARIAKEWRSNVITMIGGPFTLRQSRLIFEESQFDWVFEGAADRTLLMALGRNFSQKPLGNDIPGFSYRQFSGDIISNSNQDLITDLDKIPIPAWDMVDLERYSKYDRPRIITNIGERKYAFLFTSRGCPYLCNYCHDVFTKRFVYRNTKNVIEEIRILYEEYGVTEFHFVDDIFNLHKPRVKEIMGEISQRWPGQLKLAFPNGLRGDILDSETILSMVNAGTYHATISIETVTERLQLLVEKNLNVEKAGWAIEEFAKHGVIVQGAFMLGFPTETQKEIEETIKYAVDSKLSQAYFFAVTPQPGTPIYDLAVSESAGAAVSRSKDERNVGDYSTMSPWYSQAYGYDLQGKISSAYFRFYFNPGRMLRISRQFPLTNIYIGMMSILVKKAVSIAWKFRDGLRSRS
ncbi:MAG: radical SAM protein [Alcanivoracaceae bacterium]|nr:radical SAM protein [Alcanivoracaceae bacterium]